MINTERLHLFCSNNIGKYNTLKQFQAFYGEVIQLKLICFDTMSDTPLLTQSYNSTAQKIIDFSKDLKAVKERDFAYSYMCFTLLQAHIHGISTFITRKEIFTSAIEGGQGSCRCCFELSVRFWSL